MQQIRPEESDAAEPEEEDAAMANGDGHEHAPEASTSKGKANGKKARKAAESESESSEGEDDFLDADDDESEDEDAEVDEAFKDALLAALQVGLPTASVPLPALSDWNCGRPTVLRTSSMPPSRTMRMKTRNSWTTTR